MPFGIAQIAQKYDKPVICISGSLGYGYEELYNAGIVALFSIMDKPMSLDKAMKRGEELLEKTTRNVLNLHLNVITGKNAKVLRIDK